MNSGCVTKPSRSPPVASPHTYFPMNSSYDIREVIGIGILIGVGRLPAERTARSLASPAPRTGGGVPCVLHGRRERGTSGGQRGVADVTRGPIGRDRGKPSAMR